MRRALGLIFIVVCAAIGLWGGYWLGHLAGWSTNADWPGQIGGGVGAFMVAVVFAIAGVAVAAATLVMPTYRTARRLLLEGTPAQAVIVGLKRADLTFRSARRAYDKVCYQLEVRPRRGATFRSQACQLMTAAEEARLLPDTVVEVRYDPKRPQRAVIVGPVRADGGRRSD